MELAHAILSMQHAVPSINFESWENAMDPTELLVVDESNQHSSDTDFVELSDVELAVVTGACISEPGLIVIPR